MNKESFWELLDDTLTTAIIFFLIFGMFIAIAAIAYYLLKWMWQLFEWSVTTRSKFRWVILVPTMIATSPLWLSWLLLEKAWFQLARLFLRMLCVGKWLLH